MCIRDRIKAIIQADADNNKICPAVVEVAVKNMESIIRNFEKKKEAVDVYKRQEQALSSQE